MGESPAWIRYALEASGLRPINNVVDITNYVLLELGHPLHAFDFDSLAAGTIKVRFAEQGEKLDLIDGKTLEFTAEDLLVCDEDGPVALAGVMGGRDTEVTAKTTNILLEAAYFRPDLIRRTARRYNLQTDSSYRFERGTDRENLVLSLNRATQLIQEIADGKVVKGCLDMQPSITHEPSCISLRIDRVNSLLGLELTSTEIADYLANLRFEIRKFDQDVMVIQVPSHRIDVTREIDLIEEVARMHNYNRIPSTMPKILPSRLPISGIETIVEDARDAMTSMGFCEAVNYSFISDLQSRQMGSDPDELPRISNPLTAAQVVMRPNLLPGLLNAVACNQKQDEPEVSLFETGKVWFHGSAAGDPAGEKNDLAFVMAGPRDEHWSSNGRDVDFYDLRGILNSLLVRLGAYENPSDVQLSPLDESQIFHPGRSAGVNRNGSALGQLGEIHPDLAGAYDLCGRVYGAFIDLTTLAGGIGHDSNSGMSQVPRFPASWRDLAVVVDCGIPAGQLLEAVRDGGGQNLEDAHIFDVYEGERVGKGKKSIALRLRLRSPDHTLNEDEITSTVDRIMKQLDRKCSAVLRS